MANPEHLALLKQHVETWNEWRQANQDIKPDFSGAPLSGVNLRQAILSKAILLEAALSHINLTAVKELDTCQHEGPSILDFCTFHRGGHRAASKAYLWERPPWRPGPWIHRNRVINERLKRHCRRTNNRAGRLSLSRGALIEQRGRDLSH